MVKSSILLVAAVAACVACVAAGVYAVRHDAGLIAFSAGAGMMWFGLVAIVAGFRLALEANVVRMDID